jgi:hypothetical protein
MNHADEPEATDDDCGGVGDKHFGEFKEFGGVGGPDEGGENEEKLEGEEHECFEGGGHRRHYIRSKKKEVRSKNRNKK